MAPEKAFYDYKEDLYAKLGGILFKSKSSNEIVHLMKKIYRRLVPTLLVIILSFIFITAVFFSPNLSFTLQTILTQLLTTLCFLGYANEYYYQNTTEEITNYLKKGSFKYENLSYTEIYERTSEEIRQLRKWLCPLIVSAASLYFFSNPLKYFYARNLVKTEINLFLPLPIYMPFNTKTATGYILGITLQSLVVFTVAYNVITMIMGFVSFLAYYKANFEYLNNSLKNIEKRALNKMSAVGFSKGDKNTADYNDENFQNCMWLCLRENIIHHQNLIRFQKLVKPYLQTTYLTVIVFASLIISATGFLVIEKNNSILENMQYGVTIVAELCFVYFIHLHGEQLSQESARVSHIVYDTPWYKCQRKFKFSVCFMILNSREPVKIRTKMFNIVASMETFSSILGSSYSYLNLLSKVSQ